MESVNVVAYRIADHAVHVLQRHKKEDFSKVALGKELSILQVNKTLVFYSQRLQYIVAKILQGFEDLGSRHLELHKL